MTSRWYVGHSRNQRTVFPYNHIPTPTSHPQFTAVVGPFRTKRGCLWAAQQGWNNPHYQHVNDAEKLSKQQEI